MNSTTTLRPAKAPSQFGSYSFDTADGGIDSNWDAFLAATDSTQHTQSSLWSAVKALNGWQTKRIIVFDQEQIVGGAQMLIRTSRFLGRVGYVPKGPVLHTQDSQLADALLDQICKIAESERLKVLLVQPPVSGAVENQLLASRFRTCPIETAPTATVLVNLSHDLDTILSRMTKGMRNGVRRSQRRGIMVREGTRSDIVTFHRLLSETSQRRGFSTFDLEYFQGMWDILRSTGCMKLFISEKNREAVSAQFCIAFGDTVVAKQIGWSGSHGKLHPNEALDWFTIQWAKQHGYKYYDLEGIERPAARAIVNGQPLPAAYADSPTAYKIRLGGDVRLNPVAHCFFPNPVLRTMYNRLGIQLAKWPVFQRAANRFRTSR